MECAGRVIGVRTAAGMPRSFALPGLNQENNGGACCETLGTGNGGVGRRGVIMRYPLEKGLSYGALTLVVLAVFYSIYFAKAYAQKRRGIQTRQIGRRKEKNVHTVEALMSVATLGAPAAQLLSVALDWSCLSAGARLTGFCMP